MKNPRYEMIIWWSDEDKAFVVDVPELPGCMAHGDTRTEAVANAEEAIAFWIRLRGTMASRSRRRAVAFSLRDHG